MSDAEAGEQEPTGPNRPHRSDDQVSVQPHRRDREAHAERVDRSRALEQQRLIDCQHRTRAEPTHPLSAGLGDHHAKDQAP
ncbi:MAG TPA: hypothetical protein VLZ04_04110, partial [Gaiellaceae bacterium]|nr:hypothetical protein [Gaiellaceae bacterium]